MTPEEKNSALDRLLDGIRNEPVDSSVVDAAAGRVWARLSAEQPHAATIRGCSGYQSLIPDYLAGRLPEARRLLFIDHTHECVACRKALERASGKVTAMAARQPRLGSPVWRWAIAASLTGALGLGTWAMLEKAGSKLSAGRATVEKVDGSLYQVSDSGARVLAAGEVVTGGEIRSARETFAVLRLDDGSAVEMRERSAFRVARTRRDRILQLLRGSIIVEAVKRHAGHLYVSTPDFRVAVVGTVFSVDSGTKGSRVSVLQGQVEVSQNGAQRTLRPGDQYMSGPGMAAVPIRQEIAWSRNLDAHLAMLSTLSAVEKRLQDAQFPQVRYTSRILSLLPANTVVYASAPNLGQTFAQVQQVLHDKVQSAPALAEWWSRNGQTLDKLFTRVQGASGYLGSELVVTAALKPSGGINNPVFVAEVAKSGLRDYITSAGWPATFVDDPASPPASTGKGMFIMLRPDLVMMSPDVSAIQAVAGSSGGFAATPFGSRLGQEYQNGAGLLFAADVQSITKAEAGRTGRHNPPPGFDQMQYLVVEQKQVNSQPETRAVLSFQGQRSGIAAWLSAPAPMGTLDFISPDASLVSAAVVKSPAAIVDELLARASGDKPASGFGQVEAKTGIDVRNDLIAPLGGEFAFAIDGPALPTPSWKLVVEVYDQNRLQGAIQKLVDAYNLQAPAMNRQPVHLTQEVAGGRTFYAIVVPEGKPFTEAHYVFVDGYLLAAPNRALLDQALQYRATGYTLPRSATFTSLLPHDYYPNFSAVFYQNAGPALKPLLDAFGSVNRLSPEQKQQVEQLTAQMKPTLIAGYGGANDITVASTGTLLGLGFEKLSVFGLLGHAGREGRMHPGRGHALKVE